MLSVNVRRFMVIKGKNVFVRLEFEIFSNELFKTICEFFNAEQIGFGLKI